MNTRKMRWLSHGDIVVNLDSVVCFYQLDGNIIVCFNTGGKTVIKDMSLDDVRQYLKYGRLKRVRRNK